jgi:multiple sugar transport system permease protein
MAVMTMLFVIPVLFIFVISLTNYRLGYGIEDISFLGLGNYIRLFDGSENAFYYSIFISLVLTVLGTALQLVIGMGCAMLLNCEFKGKAVAVACMIVPIAMTPSIASQIWKLMFNNEFGIINHILNQLFHINISWLDEKHAFLSVVIATIWQYVPFVTLMLYAGLRSLPEEIYESAALDGANRIQIFFNVTLPMMKRLILLCTLLRMIDMLKTFDIPYVLTQGGPGSATKFLGLLIYDTGFGETNFVARSAAMAVILIFITSTLSLILFRIQRKNAKE